MKEYIKQGFGFVIGMGLAATAINAFNKMFGGVESKKDTKEEAVKPEEDVTVTDDVA